MSSFPFQPRLPPMIDDGVCNFLSNWVHVQSLSRCSLWTPTNPANSGLTCIQVDFPMVEFGAARAIYGRTMSLQNKAKDRRLPLQLLCSMEFRSIGRLDIIPIKRCPRLCQCFKYRRHLVARNGSIGDFLQFFFYPVTTNVTNSSGFKVMAAASKLL